MHEVTGLPATDPPENGCECEPHLDGRRLVVDATDCPNGGSLADSPACRVRTIEAFSDRAITELRVRIDGGEYVHREGTVGLLVAAARFAGLVDTHDLLLSTRTRRDPVGAARSAAGRGGRVARLAAETGLLEGIGEFDTSLDSTTGDELNPLTSASDSGCMLHDIDDAGDLSADELRTRYDERLREAIDERGVETVAEEADVPHESVAALADGDSPDITVEDAAAILATSESEPGTEAIVLEARDHLLMGMSTAVLDVEAVESGIDGALDAREIQQKIEGRLPMSLDEFAMIHGYIESRSR